ncbi:MAG: cytochrome c oxidase subunit [Verrucomicrobia bacterium]|nr:cytochrome c oxidase subunit [Verrucomicrobiota bacterium]
MSAFGASIYALIDGALPSASRVSPSFDALFLALLLTCGTVVIGLAVVILIFLVRYRAGSPAPRPPLRIPPWKLETTWITATTLVFLVFFGWGAAIYARMAEVPDGAMMIEIVGRQWMWDARHGDGRREFAELHVPVNQPIRLRLTSEDVIHSFAVPAFRLKNDAVPGKRVDTWFEATKPGRYPIYCDQYCGTKHSEMNGFVVVETAERFAAWQARAGTGSDAATRGRALSVRYGCAGCHSGDTVVRAPRLEGIAGRPVPIENGQIVMADDAYLRDSILLPNQHVAAGYAAVMPSYACVVPEGDLLDLVAYIKSLAQEQPARPAP